MIDTPQLGIYVVRVLQQVSIHPLPLLIPPPDAL